ncbi:MAG: hypothetical protein LUQ22_07320 [Methanotrichaceae archaeon]|nr:hypothetical protein [Methanotrichaceae archaeon]
MAPDVVNPRILELEVAKEILGELYGIKISEVDEQGWNLTYTHLLEGHVSRDYLLQKCR